ncbi:MAG: hypothetical protein FJ014_00550 [Chloroflexi bacterium]|nr:hypothetical protein [Chloroflexota bacterium]
MSGGGCCATWGGGAEPLAELSSPVIVVARDLTPSDTAQMNKEMVLGFCTAMGGTTSHTAIMARILGIPAVVGLGDVALSIRSGDIMIIDGSEGVVTVAPDEETIESYALQKGLQKSVQYFLQPPGGFLHLTNIFHYAIIYVIPSAALNLD